VLIAAAEAGSIAWALGRMGNCDILGKADAVVFGLVAGTGETVFLGLLSLPDIVNIVADDPPAVTLTPGDDLPKGATVVKFSP